MTPRKPSSRSSERGAALFVVVLVITLLTAVGLFAAHSATLVDQASGYSRQASQTAYLAELGALAATAEFGSGAAGAYRGRLFAPTDTCRSNAGIDADVVGAPPCLVFHLSDFTSPTGNALVEPTAIFGPDFLVEVTDPGPTGAPIAGTDVGGTGSAWGYMKVTATTISQVRPPSAATCDENLTPMTAQQMLRAHLIVGPVEK